MIFSRLMLDIGNPSVRQALRNCQDMHRNLMQAFDGERREVNLLYRLIERRDRIELYALSNEMPRWERIAKQGYSCTGIRDISALREKYREGAVLRFELLACPAKKCSFNGKNSRRVFLRTETERLEWLECQAKKYGFSLLQIQESGLRGQIIGGKEGNKLRFGTTVFSGHLQITNPEMFWNSYMKGIGAGKAYGMGLLMLSTC